MCLWNKLKSKCSVSHCILVNEVMFPQTNIYYLFGIFDWIIPIIELRLLHTIWLIILNYFKLLPESCEREAISFCSHDLHKILNQTSNSKLKHSYTPVVLFFTATDCDCRMTCRVFLLLCVINLLPLEHALKWATKWNNSNN